jgi:hypothetical protein
LAILALSSGLGPIFRRSEAHAASGDAANFALDITEVQHEMVDGKLLYSWAYAVKEGEAQVQVPSLPGPTLFVRQGQKVDVTLTNTMSNRPSGEAHGFAIFGETGTIIQSAPLAAGQSTAFTIPGTLAPGTYVYEDWVNPPVGRVLGLHGVLVVMPAATYQLYPDTEPPVEGFTPYGLLGAGHPVQQLFGDLGTTHHFPGEPWLPSRQVIWVFNEIDPMFNAMAMNHLIDPGDFQRNFLPQYFTVNGRSGYFAAMDHSHATTHVHLDFNQPLSYLLSSELEMALEAKVGQPLLIRNVAVGLDTHSPHTHANHSYILAVDGKPQGLNLDANGFPVNGNPSNLGVWWVDTWTMLPGDRKDVLYPMILPPDIPTAENLPGVPAEELAVYDTWAKLKKGAWHPTLNPEGSQELMALERGKDPQILNLAHQFGDPAFPVDNPRRYIDPVTGKGKFTQLGYPMHSHQEISQCAAGGNYPMGQISHIEFTGFVGDDHDH